MKIEPIKESQVEALIRTVTPLAALIGGLFDVDVTHGRGVLDDTGRNHCLWTGDGRRVNVLVDAYGGIIVSKEKEVDPEWEKRQGV